jgi:hypothetical protein
MGAQKPLRRNENADRGSKIKHYNETGSLEKCFQVAIKVIRKVKESITCHTALYTTGDHIKFNGAF